MAGALCRCSYLHSHANRFQRMKRFRKMLMRQIVNGHYCPGIDKWRQDILAVEDLRLHLSQYQRKGNSEPENRIFRNADRCETRIALNFIQDRPVPMEDDVLVIALIQS